MPRYKLVDTIDWDPLDGELKWDEGGKEVTTSHVKH